MPLSDLISRLEQEAQSRVHAIEQQAEAEVRTIAAATEQTIAEITARHLGHQRAERQIVEQRQLALARRHARTRELEALHEQLARILARARALVPEIADSASYREALPSHLEEALSFLENVRSRVRCQAAFAASLQPTIDRHGHAELVIDESVGPGVVAEATDGFVVVDNTLVARLARAEARLATELARELRDGD
jgi:vacuolar-type H+-ATPase subunit E/Vma4